MGLEITALEDNHTWHITTLPPGKKAIGSKWIFKLKTLPDGSLDRYKARLMDKGFHQKWGLDFWETFSPVIKSTTIHLVVGVAVGKSWPLKQVDVNTTFLQGNLT